MGWAVLAFPLFIIMTTYWLLLVQRIRQNKRYIEHLYSAFDFAEINQEFLKNFTRELEHRYPRLKIRILSFHPRHNILTSSLLGLAISHNAILHTSLPFGSLAIKNNLWCKGGLVLIPSYWLENLSPEDIQWIITHEIGHLRRFLKDFIQETIDSLFRYKQYLDNSYLLKREMAADQLAMEIMGQEKSVSALRNIGLFLADQSNSPLGLNLEIFQRVAQIKNPAKSSC